MTTTSRRLATEAKLVLEKAGYECQFEAPRSRRHANKYLVAFWRNERRPPMVITSGTVDNAEVEELLEAVK